LIYYRLARRREYDRSRYAAEMETPEERDARFVLNASNILFPRKLMNTNYNVGKYSVLFIQH